MTRTASCAVARVADNDGFSEDELDDLDEYDERDQVASVEALLRREQKTAPAAVGVVRQNLARGRASHSPAHRAVLDVHMLAEHRVAACDTCCESIPWSEQVEALDDATYGYRRLKWDRALCE